MQRFLLFLFVLNLSSICQAASPEADFEKRIRPLLAEKCWGCHNEKKQRGDLRLDSLAAMLEGGESGPALVPGEPEQSLIITAIRHNEQLKMPPKDKLPAADIAALAEWVKAGAVWPNAKPVTPSETKTSTQRVFTDEEKNFWGFQKLKSPSHPLPKTANPIDDFLQAKRKAAGLTGAPEAERRILIRRLTLDLTGLPPTPAEVDAFLKDTSPDAWEQLVERLLASSAYGEKWGRRWLDVVRYADSNGMDENLAYANAWRYRDYVIRSFNADKPYDQFVKEQIAGDLLTGGTDEEKAERLTGTGFLVIGPKMLAEDDPMKMRMDIIDEQLDTLGQAFLGLTLGCARCHDHKFDPITQADYYSLAGMFYSTKTMQNYNVVARWNERALGDAESQARMAAYAQKLKETNDRIRKLNQSIKAKVKDRLESERKRSKEYVSAAIEIAKRGTALKLIVPNPSAKRPNGSVLVEAEDFNRGNVLKLKDGYGEGIGVIINKGELPNFAEYDVELPSAGTYQIALRYAAQNSRPVTLSVGRKRIRTDAAGEVTGSWNPDSQRWFAEGVVKLPKGKTVIRLECEGPFPHFDKLAVMPITGVDESAVPLSLADVAAEKKLLPTILRTWVALAEKWNGKVPAEAELAKIASDPKGPFKSSPPLETEVDPRTAGELQKFKDQLAALEKTKPDVDEVMAVEDAKGENIRIHLRGSHLTLGAEVPRQFPVILAGEKQSGISNGSGRLQLAEWIANPNNPLTARVMTNRVWLGHFGTGLVRSPDNFGRLGERPTHPELLDYLAAEFVKSGWSVKHLHRLIVKSQSYRMSTKYTAQHFEADPDNRLYWRFNRRRLDAEEQRDGMLAVAGLLDRTPGGTLLTTKNRAYVNSTGGKGFNAFSSTRRSVYLPIIRSGVYEVLQTNDFPDPSTPAGLRQQTTVPSQALFQLNSKLADDTSEAFAKSLLDLKDNDEARVQLAYRKALLRVATPAEVARVLEYLSDSGAATGDQTVKAWQGFCRVLLASTEFAFVE